MISILVCLLVLFIMDEILINNRAKELTLMIEVVSQNVSERLESAKSLVELSAQTDNVSNSTTAGAETFLQGVVSKKSEMWSHFLMTDLEGIEFVHTEGAEHYGKSIAEREYFTTPREQRKTVIAQPIFSVSTGRKIIAIGSPVFEKEELSSVLVGFIYLQYVSQMINETSFTTNSYQMMANQDGTISAHPQEAYVLDKHMSELFRAGAIEKFEKADHGGMIALIENELCYLIFAPVGTYGLTVISVLPIFEAFADIFIITAIVLAVYMSLYFIYYYQQRLKASRKHANTMTKEAYTDNLTGLKNRQWLDKINLTDFCQEGFTVLFMDIDNFKFFNDLHNHDYGDGVLKFVGESMLTSCRPDIDSCIRYAGDEFIILLPEENVYIAGMIARRLSKVLTGYIPEGGVADPISLSCGIATGKKDRDSLKDIITKADEGVYRGKKNGKNQVVIVNDSEC